jgi:hypothetical protein
MHLHISQGMWTELFEIILKTVPVSVLKYTIRLFIMEEKSFDPSRHWSLATGLEEERKEKKRKENIDRNIRLHNSVVL